MAGTFDLGKVVGTSATINGETTLEIKAGTGVTLRQEGNILYIDLADTSSKVTSFNGRSGAVTPQNGDYTAAMVGADPAGSAQAVQANLNSHTNNKSNPHGVTPSQIGAAASSHNHSASEITSGTLSSSRGGTGQTTLTPAVSSMGVRKIYAGTSDMTAGSSSLTTGMIYLVYE